ncbi:MAG: hypothetical protein IJ785_09095 [Bacteroidales bacterium]|nr:hypothetical protein [Bacteroidales bacterium]
MKKSASTLLLLLVIGTAFAQQEPVRILNQLLRPIDTVRITVGCRVTVVTDTVDYVRVSVYADSPSTQPSNLFYYADGTLTVLPEAYGYGITVGTATTHVAVDYTLPDSAIIRTPSNTGGSSPQPRSYGFYDRYFSKILAGWSNWGDTPLNGIGGINPQLADGAYSLKPTFGSWGMELNYAIVMHEKWSLGIGVGVGFDIYRFSSPYVYYHHTENEQSLRVRNVTNRGGWECSLDNVHITFPIQLNLFARPTHTGPYCQIELIPGIWTPTSITQSYQSNENGIATSTETSDIVWGGRLLRCNLRFSLNWGILGVYLEGSLLPMLSNMAVPGGKPLTLFPVHYGFSIDFSRAELH